MAHQTTFENGRLITDYMATGIAEGFEEISNSKDMINAWSYLIGTGLAYQLQGWFGRNATIIINSGIIDKDGTVDWDEINNK